MATNDVLQQQAVDRERLRDLPRSEIRAQQEAVMTVEKISAAQYAGRIRQARRRMKRDLPASQLPVVAHWREREREAGDDDEDGNGELPVQQPAQPPRPVVVRIVGPGRQPRMVKDDEHRRRAADSVEPDDSILRRRRGPAAAVRYV